MTYQLIETKTLGSSQTSVEFTNIPQDGTDLLILAALRGTGDIKIRFNGSGTLASRRHLFGNGSSAGSGSGTDGYAGRSNAPSYTANTFANTSIYIPNYTSSTAKSYSVDSVDENNATEAFQMIIAGLWNVTSAITSFDLSDFGAGTGQFVAGSTVSLYKITRGSSNGVVVS